MVLDELKKYDRFVIYGAQVIAYGAYVAIRHLTNRKPENFVVNRLDGNPPEIDDIKVKLLDDVEKDTFLIVGVTELIQKEVIPYLKEHGYKNIYALTQHEEHLLMSRYFNSIGKFPCVELSNTMNAADNISLKIFEIHNHKDKPLKLHPALADYEYSIQAGAALTKDRIAEYTDDTGFHISNKNKQYCEMSAVYWLWKNMHCDWIGIEHYRRHLLVKPEYISENIDAIMPLPYICYPNEMTQFQRFVSKDVSEALLQALLEVHPDEFEQYQAIVYGQYQYTYNLVCAKKSVFDDYCRWFFEITEHMEIYVDKVPEIRDTRALSYVAEVLTNLYFMSNADKLRIWHVEKEIYV